MSTLSAKSNGIFRTESSTSSRNEAVLVTAPRCVSSSDRNDPSVVRVESETFQNVDVSEQICSNPILRFFKESGFAKKSSIDGMDEKEATELDVLARHDHSSQLLETYDSCREYRYSDAEDDDDDDDDDDDEYDHNDRLESQHRMKLKPSSALNETTKLQIMPFAQVNTQQNNHQEPENNDVIYVLGRQYHAIYDYSARRDDESSLFWLTYRCDFPSMDPYGITSDAGWGCMLRATQMLLAQTLRLHYKGRDWRPPTAQANQSLAFRARSDPFIRSILTWFADFPSSNAINSGDSIYSLHNMVAVGLAKYDKLPGEWYGPGTACYVLRDLVERHEKQHEESLDHLKIMRTGSNDSFDATSRRMFRVHVASSEGAVYRDEMHKLMTRNIRADEETRQPYTEKNDVCQSAKQIPSHPLDFSAWEDELVESSSTQQKRDLVEWDTALLLLIPLRLGLKNFNSEYVEVVAHTFSLPQSVGVLGGRPRGARWFYGAQVNNNNPKQIFGLDPHTVQTAPRRRMAAVNGISKQIVELSDEYLRSVHTTFPETFSIEKMDPSIALGFYCYDHADLENLFENLKAWKDAHPKSPELFHVQDTVPDYDNDDLLAMNDDHDIGASLIPNPKGRDIVDDASDEDEYVML